MGTVRKIWALLLAGLMVGSLGIAEAAPADLDVDGPSAGGISSDNVEFIKHVPLSVDGVGGRLIGKYFYTNDAQKIMIFDVSDPVNPELTGTVLMPQEIILNREDLDGNGDILIVPNTVTGSADGTPPNGSPTNA